MARLRRLSTQQVRPLAAHALVGRSPACFSGLDAEHASKAHAVLAWSDGGWWIKDLGSRNGTFVDGHGIDPGAPRRLTVGARVAFGRAEDVWIFDDDAPPEALALNLATRALRKGAGGLLALPDDTSPKSSSFSGPTGDGRRRAATSTTPGASSTGRWCGSGASRGACCYPSRKKRRRPCRRRWASSRWCSASR